jgi:hypothetical protein
VCSKPFIFILKSKPTAIFTVVFRGVSIKTAIVLDCPWCSVVFPWCSGVFGTQRFFWGLQLWCFRGVPWNTTREVRGLSNLLKNRDVPLCFILGTKKS